MRELRQFGGLGNLRRVPVCDLREVRAGAQRPSRDQSVGACRIVLGPWRGSRYWSRLWCPSNRAAHPQDGGIVGHEDRQAATGEEVSQIFCRVCGDCHFGPWGIHDRLRVLTCEGCDDAFALLAQLRKSRRLELWTLVGNLGSEWFDVHTETPESSAERCGVCNSWLAPNVPRNVYRRRGNATYCACLRCGYVARYLVQLGALKLELVKAFALIEGTDG